ncbi:hypothetical protein CALVIDRAFT_373931 [Calocera viscosa TUFC12733]|uniref:Uncharacterized protein n=1 Tax=Calocera viscosa (strain TUFC12733) TaxID=1330018 RepID=A0A167GRR6_CALVF|nr:hypothetical protein CALVIDRAFT_373931 [Calocera viscosa TUFC12733]
MDRMTLWNVLERRALSSAAESGFDGALRGWPVYSTEGATELLVDLAPFLPSNGLFVKRVFVPLDMRDRATLESFGSGDHRRSGRNQAITGPSESGELECHFVPPFLPQRQAIVPNALVPTVPIENELLLLLGDGGPRHEGYEAKRGIDASLVAEVEQYVELAVEVVRLAVPQERFPVRELLL